MPSGRCASQTHHPSPLPQALALLDGLAGGGDSFWETYANAVLPAPLELTLPLCFPPALLPELQHGAIEAGAQAQQERLAGLFPGLAAPMAESSAGPGPSWLQWGFGSVRRWAQAGPMGKGCPCENPALSLGSPQPLWL